MIDTWLILNLTRQTLRKFADESLPQPVKPLPFFISNIQPGDKVWLKQRIPTTLTSKWTGPYQVVLNNPMEAKLREIPGLYITRNLNLLQGLI